jgi:sterol desaturase/sphingolipid hydroxylase (fatty acid hydroxylase superfamily)
MATWSVAEYLIHRFRGHEARNRNAFQREHLRHHGEPYFFSPWKVKVQMAAPSIVGVLIASLSLLGPAVGLAYTLSFVATYTSYEVVHRRIHTRPPRGRVSRALRRHHLHHHFVRSTHNHGVTSRIWDRVFGTFDAPTVIPVPRTFAPRWLLDGDGGLRPEYAGDYKLVGRA